VITQGQGTAWFQNNNQRIRYQLEGNPTVGGQFQLLGEYLPATQQFNLQTQGKNLSVPWLDHLLRLPLDYLAGRGDGNVAVRWRPGHIPLLNGTAQFQAVTLRIPSLPQLISGAGGELRFQDKLITLGKTQGRYGLVPARLNGTIDQEKGFNLVGRVQSVKIEDAQKAINLKLPFPTLGQIAVDLKLTGSFTQPLLAGIVRSVQGLQADKVKLQSAIARFQVLNNLVSLTDIKAIPIFGGQLTGNGKIILSKQGNLALNFRGENLPASPLTQLYLQLPFATTGQIATNVKLTGNFAQPLLTGTVQSTQEMQVDKVRLQTASANFQVINSIASLTDIYALPIVGGQITGDGTVNLTPQGKFALNLRAANMPGDALSQLYGYAAPLQIGPVAAQVQVTNPITASPSNPAGVQTLVQWQAPRATYPARGNVAIAGDTISLRDTILQVAGGTMALQGEILQSQKRWQAIAALNQIRLGQFSSDLRGRLNGQLQLAGTTEPAGPASTRAAGTVRFSQGLALIEDPLTAQIRWDGEKVLVQQATAPSFRANGIVFAQLEGKDAPQLTGFDLNVVAQNYDLKRLPFATEVAYADLKGRANFTGRLTGTPENPQIVGALNLKKLDLNGLAFDPVMTGRLRYEQGLNLQLAGQRDHIAVQTNATNRPTSFLVQRDQAIATGKTVGELFRVQVRNFPLEMFQYPQAKAAGLEPVRGTLQGDVAVNWDKLSATGAFAIARPQVGALIGDRLTGEFQYANNVATLSKSEFRHLDSQYLLQGRLNLAPKRGEPQVQANLQIPKGRVQDVLSMLRWFEVEDIQRGFAPSTFAKAADVRPNPIELPEGSSLQDQLRRFSEILALQEQQRNQKKQGLQIPSLTTLEGNFQGNIQAMGSFEKGVAVDFNLQGQDWQWDTYPLRQVEAKGRWADGILTLLPIQLQSGKTLLSFNGQIGSKQQQGKVLIQELPIGTVQEFLNLPAKVAGRLNASATLSGSLDNPQAEGKLTLKNGKVNGEAVESAQGTFKYTEGRLSFNSQAAFALEPTNQLTPPEPIFVSGNIPLPLPFASVQPQSQQIDLDLNVKNQGLSLLNLVNSQVRWVDGQGQLKVQVRGTLEQPVATGLAQLENATLSASALPEPLRGVTGTIRFDNELVQVDQLEGQFSQGQITAQGVIPLVNRFTVKQNQQKPFLPVAPLVVNLDKLSLNLQGLYRGGVDGEIVVTGAVLEPVLSGEVALSNGQAFLPADQTATQTTLNGTTANPSPTEESNDIFFADLKLNLGDRLRITGPQINFIAKGDLTLNGSLNDPRPQGTIELIRGQVNVYTTLFTLDPTYKQRAVFTPAQGLDPNLDVQMITSVPEVTRTPLPESPLVSSEIAIQPSTNIGALQTIRIQAKVKGPASQISNNLELKSSPTRSSNEIIALLGGGFVSTLGRGDTTLSLANLASSAFLTNVQAFLGQTLGLSDFRIFPAIIPKEGSRNPSTIDIAAEAGVPITSNFSVSVLGVLTSQDPQVLFNLRYRISDEFQIRVSTDFTNDSRAIMEFEKRF
jgi:translocation and assembly module TamB